MNLQKSEKPFNYGLALLKAILSFYVVRTHCFHENAIKNKALFYVLGKKRRIHVPSFFNISFYFNHSTLLSRDSKRKSQRFERLLIPYIFWPLIIYSLNNVLVII